MIQKNIVQVIVENKSKHTDALYTYGADQVLAIGQKVRVPFSRGNKIIDGFVVKHIDEIKFPIEKLKDIEQITPDICLNEEMVDTSIWMKRRFGTKYWDSISCFAPTGKATAEHKKKEPYKDIQLSDEIPKELTDEQKNALQIINGDIDINMQSNFLIHGVTGSGKTELYIQVINKIICEGKSAIVLVPEIALTKQVIERFVNKFGKNQIAVLHSKLTKRERYDEWMRIRNKEARIVIGARMAVFAPVENIGAIILDEEHEQTYKSDSVPKYETVDIAHKRVSYYGGVLVLGSATPSVASYQRAKDGIYTLIEMKERYNKTPMPDVQIVDMREEMRNGNLGYFSNDLYSGIKENLKSGKQVILFLNRRGFSTIVECNTCGTVRKCPDCDIPLIYHKKKNSLQCRYCGRSFPEKSTCVECKGEKFSYLGAGTQKIEDEIERIFPDAKVARLDIDTAKNRREIEKILTDFDAGNVDILVGTQLVSKGLDFKNVGIVGVIMADTSLNIPDYRSSEKTFQLITQVSGRSGRGDEKGSVIVQTNSPTNYAITTAANHDYEAFFDKEIAFREMMDYPPFTDMIVPLFTSSNEDIAKNVAIQCKNSLLNMDSSFSSAHMLEPRFTESFISKKDFRYHMIIKSPKELRTKYVYYLSEISKQLLEKKIPCDLTIDVNPFSVY